MQKHKRNRRTRKVHGIKNSKQHLKRAKAARRYCALCHRSLLGVPHGLRKAMVRKLSKTKKRPSGLFGGILCSPCKTNILQEALRVKTSQKTTEDVLLNERNFVQTALAHINRVA